ncbi:MAG: Pseudouridine synthase [Candidatus Uhrbacteria bacterium GW2011_GWF2_41_16]|jgi:23S rRNA pseudouridine1911/1915/1917 synthase|uniref:Pseudouridine synthase n=2 Tax=Candidatus Uhriibacteriota TaxID=1752732 RepID=A0A0G0VBN2_9BACT|nr:MAG: Pseudouridine synthase [Candidatus Uhrbacteria bacterium GW2011_GWC2_41_11]KKR98338.1 MAG: Pseudouridine synthase [Candidatus Uhrbacteria bacterium GW2011_GWF2_41_16]HBP00061.1 RNA pseudouridine synthase [Candidatus Uhrbacteria bacterium]
MQTWNIPETTTRKRLDLFLVGVLGHSRAQIQKIIKDGMIHINGEEIKKPHFFLSSGDKITYKKGVTEPSLPKETKKILTIVYEDKNVLVVNKPAGLLIHTAGGKEQTLVDLVLKHTPSIRTVGENPTRPGIVHRLDKLASGVIIVAKTQSAFDFLKMQFANRLVEKEYLVLVYGQLPKEAGTIRFPLSRSKKTGRMSANPEGTTGKEAVTHYRVVSRFKTATLVSVHIETGRTHQIRAHFKAIDHPVVGDPLYKKRTMRHIRPISLPRLFLHAHTLTISLPDEQRKTFTAPLPDELSQLLTTLPTPSLV